jgi:hypothetical protein
MLRGLERAFGRRGSIRTQRHANDGRRSVRPRENERRRRAARALVISLLLNAVLIVLALSSHQSPRSRITRILNILWKPFGAIAEWVAPAGHDLGYFLGSAFVAIPSFVLFYTVVVWAVLNLLAWWRNRSQAIDGGQSSPYGAGTSWGGLSLRGICAADSI